MCDCKRCCPPSQHRGHDLKVLCVTWNCGESKAPSQEQLAHLLRPGDHDVYAVAFQENDKKDEWFAAIRTLLAPKSAQSSSKNLFKRVFTTKSTAWLPHTRPTPQPRNAHVFLFIGIVCLLVVHDMPEQRRKSTTVSTISRRASAVGIKGKAATSLKFEQILSTPGSAQDDFTQFLALHDKLQLFEFPQAVDVRWKGWEEERERGGSVQRSVKH